MTHAVSLVVQRGDGMNVETIKSVEDGVGSTSGETRPFFHIFMSEAIQDLEVGGGDVVDREEESDRRKEIFRINPEFIL